MSVNFEDTLRADMGQVRVQPRPGLAREAHRRYLKRRRRTALAVAATAAAAAVAGVTAGLALTTRTAGTAGNTGTGSIETTASVVKHVGRALAATDAIGFSSSEYSGAGTPVPLRERFEVWRFGGQSRQLVETPSGQPLVDTSSRPEGRTSVLVQVSYQPRTWITGTLSAGRPTAFPAGDNLCDGTFAPQFSAATAADWRRIIESGLTCGAFTVDGRQWVDGVDAIKLTGRKTVPQATLWVDPASYLPVRLSMQVRMLNGSGKQVSVATLTTDFRWLPPTRANLAQLTAPIPPGFRQVSLP